jgi:hypothetical protein
MRIIEDIDPSPTMINLAIQTAEMSMRTNTHI